MCVCIHICFYIDESNNTDVSISGRDMGIMLEGGVKSDAKSILHT